MIDITCSINVLQVDQYPIFFAYTPKGEREFPCPVIPGNTSLKFPFPWHFVISPPLAFCDFPSRSGKRKFWPGIKTGNTIIICSFAGQGIK